MLWDPVVDGGAYLRELAALHGNYMRLEMGAADWRDRRGVNGDGMPAEALGTPISAAFAAELAAIDLSAEELRTDNVTLIRTGRTGGAGEAAAMDRMKRSTVHWIDLPASESWNSDAALNAAIVPMDVVQAIVARVEELSP